MKDRVGDKLFQGYLSSALAYHACQDYDYATTLLFRALQNKPLRESLKDGSQDDYDILLYGAFHHQKKNLDRAISIYQSVGKESARFQKWIGFNLASAYLERGINGFEEKRYSQAISDFDEAIK